MRQIGHQKIMNGGHATDRTHDNKEIDKSQNDPIINCRNNAAINIKGTKQTGNQGIPDRDD